MGCWMDSVFVSNGDYFCDILSRVTSLILMQLVRFSSCSCGPDAFSMMDRTPASDTLGEGGVCVEGCVCVRVCVWGGGGGGGGRVHGSTIMDGSGVELWSTVPPPGAVCNVEDLESPQ